MDKVLARFFIEEISSAVSQEEYPCVLLGSLAKLRSFTLDENVTVFFFLAVHRLLQGRVYGKLLVDCMINSDNGGLSTALECSSLHYYYHALGLTHYLA